MDKSEAIKVLEICPDSTFFEMEQAYKDLLSIWDPDRHSHNSRLLEKAHQKIKDLDAAYDLLSLHYAGQQQEERTHPEDVSFKSNDTIMTCCNCAAKNRIQDIPGVIFRCGKCKKDLFAREPSSSGGERIACADGSCIGVIKDGRCSVCGKSLGEGRITDQKNAEIQQEAYKKNQQKYEREKKRSKIIKYSLLLAVVLFLFYGYFSSNSTISSEAKELSAPVSISPRNINNTVPDSFPHVSQNNFGNGSVKKGKSYINRPIAYIAAFFLGPLLGSLGGIVLLPLLLPLQRNLKYFPIGQLIIGFATVWVSSKIFLWFGFKLSLLMVMLLALGFALNSLRRLRATNEDQYSWELSFSLGELVGVAAGGFYIL